MMYSYSTLLSERPQAVAEKPYEYKFLSERHIQAMWFEQKYFKNLTTSTGEPIEVLSPGIWNAEAGPDFLKAHFKIGTQDLRGDVEIHFVDENWYQHQHHTDERYNNTVLHISLCKPDEEKPLLKKNGQQLILAHLESYLTLSQNRIVQLIDLELYPYKKFVGSGRCAKTLFKSLPEEKTITLFKDAADWRLLQKRRFLETHTQEPSLQLGLGMAMALGYKNNTDAFLNLFLYLHHLHLDDEQEFFALAMRSCGFFEEEYQRKWDGSPYYRGLYQLGMSLQHPIQTTKLALNQIRPYNHPVRRMVMMSKMLADRSFLLIYDRIISMWKNNWSACTSQKHWNNLRKKFYEQIPTYKDAYWNRHFIFEIEPQEEHLSLIGEDLKKEILINTVLPLIQGCLDSKNSREIAAFENFYMTFPASITGKTKYLTHRFFGDTPKGSVLDMAYTEQGAYQLHRDFCIHYEASCEGCSFVERYKQGFE